MTFSNALATFFSRHKLLIGAIFLLVLYGYYISNVTTKPPGFYVDESCLAYNGYLIATTGAGENGVKFPLYFQCYTQGYSQWANPTHVYLLSLLYLVVPPSNLLARIFAATMVFLAALLLGLLAKRISGKNVVGVIVAVTAMFTPWLFEISRMVLETFFYPLAIALFLFCLYNAFRRGKWTILDCTLIALTLSLITYSYTIGRLLGPVLGLGLLIFATSWKNLFSVIKTGSIYTFSMIPFLFVYFGNSPAITGRFQRATYIDGNKPLLDNLSTFVASYISDLSLDFLLFVGDKHPRHHIVGMGEILIGAFALSVLGVLIIFIRYRGSAWWRYVIFGTLVSIIPGALTTERYHSLRLVAFPVFFSLLMVPAIDWLLESKVEIGQTATGFLSRITSDRFARRGLLYGLIILTAIQGFLFQVQFQTLGGARAIEFNEAYPRVLEKALAQPSRPIYLDEGGEPAYIHAYWYAASWGVDRSNFVHLLDNQYPPYDAIVISSEGACNECEMINHDGSFLLYRNKKRNAPSQPLPAPNSDLMGSGFGQFMRPRGVATDAGGNRYVTDTDNFRIQKFDAEGNFLSLMGSFGSRTGQVTQPHGVETDSAGRVFVTDASRHVLLRFRHDGSFEKEWTGPEEGYFGPRDLAFSDAGKLYIVDQGRARIVRFDPATEEYFEWGKQGVGDGEFDQPTGIDVAGGFVFVADIGNDRVQVFDLNGEFVRQWPMPEWARNIPTFPDVAYDVQSKQVFVSSGSTNEIRVYDIDGKFIETVQPRAPAGLNNPSSLQITHGPYGNRLIVLNTGSDNPVTGKPSVAVIEIRKVPAKK